MAKLLWDDVGGNTSSRGDIVQQKAQSFDEGLPAAAMCQQAAVPREGVEKSEEAQSLDESTDEQSKERRGQKPE